MTIKLSSRPKTRMTNYYTSFSGHLKVQLWHHSQTSKPLERHNLPEWSMETTSSAMIHVDIFSIRLNFTSIYTFSQDMTYYTDSCRAQLYIVLLSIVRQICFADCGDAGSKEMIRILPFWSIWISRWHLAIFRIKGIHPATYAIPETDSDDLILAGTTNYKHPAIIDMFTK